MVHAYAFTPDRCDISSQINKHAESEAIHDMDWVKEKMHQASLQRDKIQEKGDVTAHGNGPGRNSKKVTRRHSGYFTLTQKLSWLFGGVLLGSLLVTMAWKSNMDDTGNNSGARDLSIGVSEQHRNLVELPSPSSTHDTEGLKRDLALLSEYVQTLATSVFDLKIKLQQIHAVTDSIAALGNVPTADISQQQGTLPSNVAQLETLPSPAAGEGYVSVTDAKETNKIGEATGTPPVAKEETSPATPVKKTQAAIVDSGPWVINLASLPHKADADRFVANAESKGVTAGLYQVTVRGNDYWRVHVPGFATAEEAKTKASLIKKKLGLKDAWVAKR